MKISQLQKLMHNLPADADLTDAAWRSAYLRKNGMEPGDLYQELEMESRYVDTHIDISYANSGVNLHSHSFFELIYCTNTCGVEYMVGTNRYCLQKGDIILVPPGMSHRPLLPEYMPQPYARQVLWISTELFRMLDQFFPGMHTSDPSYSLFLRTADTPWASLGDFFSAGIREAERREDGWEQALVGNTVTLLVHLRRAFLDRATGGLKAELPELLDQVMEYVEAHLADKITLSQVAHHFYVSESTITQTFRKKMGVSFYQCVTQRRLIAAKAYIARDMPLEEVGVKVGFSDYSSFYRAFKREYGISPRQYRKLQP